MAYVSPRMSLKIWSAGGDPYDHEQLADNFLKFDQHDHSQGRGTPIGTDGIREGAITSVHIYPGSLDAGSISDGTLTEAKLAPSARIPIGTVIDYYCATPAQWDEVVSQGWEICDGSTVLAAAHQIPGVAGDFTLPNLIGRVTMGANPARALNAASTAGNTNGDAPGVGGVGGSNVVHSHTVSQFDSLTKSGTLSVDTNASVGMTSYAHQHNVPSLIGRDVGSYPYIIDPGSGDGDFGGGSVGFYDNGVNIHSILVDSEGVFIDQGALRYYLKSDEDSHSHTLNTHGHSITDTHYHSVPAHSTNTSDGRMLHYGLLKLMKVRIS